MPRCPLQLLLVLLALSTLMSRHVVLSGRLAELEEADSRALRRQDAFDVSLPQLSSDDASLEMAVRQSLLDYGVDKGLEILTQKVYDIQLPNFTTTAQLPLFGGVNVGASNIRFQNFQIPKGAAAVSIESGFYHLRASGVQAQVSFDWGWDKGIISGSGYGDLSLTDGALDMIFTVKTETKGIPHVQTASAAFSFGSLDLDVHSYSLDWLYQALLFLFSGAIKGDIESQVHDALLADVPQAVNDVLDTLPAEVVIQGLPFQTVFTYALYTLNYVLVKGYGQVQAAPKGGPAARPAAAAAAAASADLVQCPFPVSPLSLPAANISGEGHMASLYMHQNVLNCIFWGLYQGNSLGVTVRDGEVPGVRLVANLFGQLMPQLPRLYPGKGLQLEVSALSPPLVQFTQAQGVSVAAEYETQVSVLDAQGDGQTVQMATLRANLTVNGDLDWDSTSIKSVDASYSIVSNATAVNLAGWNTMIKWIIQTYGAKVTMQQLMEQYVQTPASPFVHLERTKCSTFDSWYAVSTDLKLLKLPVEMKAGNARKQGHSRDPGAVHVPRPLHVAARRARSSSRRSG